MVLWAAGASGKFLRPTPPADFFTRPLTLDFQLRAGDFNFPAWHLLKLM
jgi:hypothetical protein